MTNSKIVIEANTKALQTACSLAVRKAWEGGDGLASDSCLKGFLMIYLMGPDNRQSFEAAASKLTLGMNSPKTTRRFYLYQVRQLIFSIHKAQSRQVTQLKGFMNNPCPVAMSLLTGVYLPTDQWWQNVPSLL